MIVDTVRGEIILEYQEDTTGHFAIYYDDDEDIFHNVNLDYVEVKREERTVKEIFCAYCEYFPAFIAYEKLQEMGIIKEEE